MSTPAHGPAPTRPWQGGYTLIELIVAVGLFALVMTLTTGAYLVMTNANRDTQALATGIDNLSFALESMTRSIRTGSNYSQIGQSYFSLTDSSGQAMVYQLGSQAGIGGTVGDITANGVVLTSPSVNITSLAFYTSGTTPGDSDQPHVTIIVSGVVLAGPNKTEPFTVETGATMRGSDI